MPKPIDGTLVQIEAMHDFNTVVAQRAFAPHDHKQIQIWIEYVTTIKLDQAQKKDPSFDAYSFEPKYIPIIVQITDQELA